MALYLPLGQSLGSVASISGGIGWPWPGSSGSGGVVPGRSGFSGFGNGSPGFGGTSMPGSR